MSLDYNRIPASIEQQTVQYADARQITPEEAFVEIFANGLKSAKRKVKSTPQITDAELAAFDKAFPAIDKLADVTDEQWDRVLKSARRMSREGLSGRA